MFSAVIDYKNSYEANTSGLEMTLVFVVLI